MQPERFVEEHSEVRAGAGQQRVGPYPSNESNDILAYIDGLPSDTPTMMARTDEEVSLADELLALEQSRLPDMRTLTFGFLMPAKMARKSEETLRRYEQEGAENPARLEEVRWWREFGLHGVRPEDARASVRSYREAFERLEQQLSSSDWLLGNRLSIVDVAWFAAPTPVGL